MAIWSRVEGTRLKRLTEELRKREGMRADRYNEGKSELSMCLEHGEAMRQWAAGLVYGKKKYARGNWRKGLPVTSVCDSLLRHTLAYLNGEDIDPESGLPHTGFILCNAAFLCEFAVRPELDDRVPCPTTTPNYTPQS